MESFFPYRLAVTAETFARQLVAVYGHRYGLSREEWRLLFLLEDAGALDSVQIVQRTSLDKVQVSRAASRLEGKGLITRSIAKEDRRLRHYAVTGAGADLFRRAFDEVQARAGDILDSMAPDDRAALQRGVEALARAMAGRPAPGGDRACRAPDGPAA